MTRRHDIGAEDVDEGQSAHESTASDFISATKFKSRIVDDKV